MTEPGTTDSAEPADDDAIRALVARLSRRHSSGGEVIERAAILAEGANSAAILRWIAANAWEPEDPEPAAGGPSGLGLHGMRREAERAPARAPRRYVRSPG
jgi:hypothetical protein